jgi:hypothetical protein
VGGPTDTGATPVTNAAVDAILERPRAVERVAALAALATLCVAVVLVIAGAAEHWLGVLLTLWILLVVVVAGWYLVSRRGVRRSVALAVGAGALAVLSLVCSSPTCT